MELSKTVFPLRTVIHKINFIVFLVVREPKLLLAIRLLMFLAVWFAPHPSAKLCRFVQSAGWRRSSGSQTTMPGAETPAVTALAGSAAKALLQVELVFDEPTQISSIKFWNYSRIRLDNYIHASRKQSQSLAQQRTAEVSPWLS